MTLTRKDLLLNNEIYHVFSRSIAGYVVFNNPAEFDRIIALIKLCRFTNFNYRYSQFSQLGFQTQTTITERLKKDNNVLVEIIAYCIMPTHIHLLLKQVVNNGTTKYIGRILNSYSKYFNTKHKRSGPLWTGRFKNLLVFNDEQLLHLTRYIHLNPTSANLVKNPEEWAYSSYSEYIKPNRKKGFCSFEKLFDFSQKEYKQFCLDRKSYQKELSKIKSLLIEKSIG